jgi:hypothetical protein
MGNRVQGWKVLLSVVLLVLSTCGCASEKAEPQPAATPQESAGPLNSAAPLPRSFKGYELYSWKSGTTWYFTLITGTNRLKTLAEITSSANVEEGDWLKITVAGVSELKSVLGRLPPGSHISWDRARHLVTGLLKPGPNLRRPPARVVREVQAYCAELGLDLNAGR